MERKRIFELFQELRGIENVVGVGNGIKQVRGENTGKQAAVILVKKKYAKDNLRRSAIIPKRIDGMLTDVVEVGDIRLFDAGRTERQRPAKPGISIGHFRISAGTFGAVVRDNSTGRPLILSNNHS